ncbi:MAG: hypothetical protein ACO1OR_00740 [Hydrogenophaga sp.]|uniref:hypothetical protein n=1 Tax=Hydrogenophaga intermedia TaxID=65786 RepID=UPI00204400D5|nr:hypothetical protein [Hydrogenophaga intermedia]MCM3565657.1 hypothetical protein [Hydrogenophaga intermedia]
MTTPADPTPRSTTRLASIAALALCSLLAACETAPRAGAETTAQVLQVAPDRDSLRDGYPALHAALRAGVVRRDLEEARLVQGECGVPDASRSGGTRWVSVTTLVPRGTALAQGSRIVVRDARSAWAGVAPERASALHGQFVRVDDTPPTRTTPACHTSEPAGATTWHLRVHLTPPAWQHDFASAAFQRLDALRDEDFAAGRVLRLGCQLKVIDGGDWYAPQWVALAPPQLPLKVGDVVRLRAGAQMESKDVGPRAEVLARLDNVPTPAGNATVRCN